MYPHRIRLRGPWNCDSPSPRIVTMPCRWDEICLSNCPGRVRLRRAFGYPGRIDVYERVWLTIAGLSAAAEVSLNQRPLQEGVALADTLEFDVTSLLRSRNELGLELDCRAGHGEVWSEIALEVRCTAFLRAVRRIAILIEDRIELRVTGQVCGQAERPLELYVLLEGSVVHYQLVTATAEGTSFDVHLTDLPAGAWRGSEGEMLARLVQVDLVYGAVVWYSSTEAVRPQTVTL